VSRYPAHVTLRASIRCLRSPRVFPEARRAIERRGSIWDERYHARPLRTPREVRNAIAYVLHNFRKHQRYAPGIDPCSSAQWFDGFRGWTSSAREESSVVPARTWLLRVGWKRHGLIELAERPASAAGRFRRFSHVALRDADNL